MTALDNVRAMREEIEQLKRGAERWQEKADNFRLLYGEAMDQLKDRSEEVDRLRHERDQWQALAAAADADKRKAEADAARYRWLRANATPPTLASIAWGHSKAACKFSDPDAAIDAALKEQK